MKRFYYKLDGTPAIVIGVVALSAIAFYAQASYRHLEEEKVRILSDLAAVEEKHYESLKVLHEKENTIKSFENQIGEIFNTVGTLEKLSQIDKELLKKYSKVYFLNENYIPPALTDIDEKYLVSGSTNFMILAHVWPYLRNMLEVAERSGVKLRVASAYRSFGTQATLKSAYKVTYGSGANTFSADQGYSEHQLGTALDLSTDKLGPNFSALTSEPAYKWLLDHAYQYGFILSYPTDNAYYKFEPWHWRFVGVKLATTLHNEGKHFYDLDQREIDKYLITIFE